jgi:hypothetical protein
MFKFRPLDAKSDILRLRGLELSLGFGDGLVRVDAGVVQRVRQLEGFLIGNHRRIQKRLKRVLPAKLKVVLGDFRLNREACVF